MKLRTKKLEKWVAREIDGGRAEFLLSPLTPKESTTTMNQATNYKWEKNQRFEDLDFYKFKMAKIDKVITDWKGVEDEDGSPIKCDRAGKELVYAYNRDLIDSLLDEADKIVEQEVKEAEFLAKN